MHISAINRVLARLKREKLERLLELALKGVIDRTVDIVTHISEAGQ